MKKEKGKKVISAAVVLATVSTKKKAPEKNKKKVITIKQKKKSEKKNNSSNNNNNNNLVNGNDKLRIVKKTETKVDFQLQNNNIPFIIDRASCKAKKITTTSAAATTASFSTTASPTILNNNNNNHHFEKKISYTTDTNTTNTINNYGHNNVNNNNYNNKKNKPPLVNNILSHILGKEDHVNHKQVKNVIANNNNNININILTSSWRLGHSTGRYESSILSSVAYTNKKNNNIPSSIARHLLGYPIFADITFGYLSNYMLEEEMNHEKSKLLHELENEVIEFHGKGARLSMFVVRTMGWMLGKVWRRLFSTVKVDEMNILKAREISMEKPIVLLPSHKSHVDYLMMSYICFAYNFPIPVICAGENLNIFGIGVMLRYAGCFFMKRSFRSLDMAKYRIACKKYVHGVLSLSSNNSDENNSSSKDFNTSNINENEKMEGNKNTTKKLNNSMLEFFMEGGRSRTGKLIKARLGMLSMVVDSKHDCAFMPVALTYDMIPEIDDYVEQLLGKPKSPESLSLVLHIGYRLFIQKMMMVGIESSRYNCGNAYIRFAPSYSMFKLVDKYDGNVEKIACFLQRQVALNGIIPHTSLIATIILMERCLRNNNRRNTRHHHYHHPHRRFGSNIRIHLSTILKKVLILKDILVQIGAYLPNDNELNTIADIKKLLPYLGYRGVKYDNGMNGNVNIAAATWEYIELPSSPHVFLKLAYLRNQLIHFFTGMYEGIEREIIFNEYQYGVEEKISVNVDQTIFLKELLKSFIMPYKEAYAATISFLPFDLLSSGDEEMKNNRNSICKSYIKLAQDSIKVKLYSGDIKCHEALSLDTLKNAFCWFVKLDMVRKQEMMIKSIY